MSKNWTKGLQPSAKCIAAHNKILDTPLLHGGLVGVWTAGTGMQLSRDRGNDSGTDWHCARQKDLIWTGKISFSQEVSHK